MNGNHGDSVMAQAGLTVRRTCQADAKAGHSEPTIRFRDGGRLSDKSYSGDNRLVPPKSPYRRRSSAPRCRLILSWGWRRSQGYGCSPFKKIRELGSDRSGFVKRSLNSLNPLKVRFEIKKQNLLYCAKLKLEYQPKNSRRSRIAICAERS